MLSYDVLICTYNGSKYIKQQIESILNQFILPRKIIISDDFSKDNTLDIIKDVFFCYKYENYEIVYGPQKGAKYNFLSSLIYTQSDYIFFSDQDDIWCPNKIDIIAETVYDTVEPLLVFSDSQIIDENGNLISASFFDYQGLTARVFDDDSILFKNCVQGATACINKPMRDLILKSLNNVNWNNLYMHDWWIALLAKYFGKFIFISQPLIEYRQHSDNQIGAFSKEKKWKIYIKKFHLFINNFCLAIKQAKEFKKFYSQECGKFNHIKQYKYIPALKRVIVRFIK